MKTHARSPAVKNLVRAVAIAAVTSFASWAVTRYFDRRAEKRRARAPRRSVETWENEGGALAPYAVHPETSQVPR